MDRERERQVEQALIKINPWDPQPAELLASSRNASRVPGLAVVIGAAILSAAMAMIRRSVGLSPVRERVGNEDWKQPEDDPTLRDTVRRLRFQR